MNKHSSPTPTIEDSIDILFAERGKLDLKGYTTNEYGELRAALTLLITKAKQKASDD